MGQRFNKKYAFRVEIDGIEVAAFKKCGPLSVNISEVVENEGGQAAPTKELSKVSYDDVVLAKGVTNNEEMWDWAKAAVDGDDDAAEKDFSVVQLDRAGEELKRWDCFGGKPKKFVAGDWDADADENIVEELTISIEKFDKG